MFLDSSSCKLRYYLHFKDESWEVKLPKDIPLVTEVGVRTSQLASSHYALVCLPAASYTVVIADGMGKHFQRDMD